MLLRHAAQMFTPHTLAAAAAATVVLLVPSQQRASCVLLGVVCRQRRYMSHKQAIEREKQPGFNSGMELVFLGTGAGGPSIDRGASAIALRFSTGGWLFDCGEGTAQQLQRSVVRQSQLTHFFITHMHGDHVLGLPGLLMHLAYIPLPDNAEPLHIYGPVGLYELVCASYRLCQPRNPLAVVVHELIVPSSPGGAASGSQTPAPTLSREALLRGEYGSVPVQRVEVLPDADGIYALATVAVPNGPGGTLTTTLSAAAQRVPHIGLPCFGYAACETHPLGRIDVRKLSDWGLAPGAVCRDLLRGECVRLPGGGMVFPEDVITPAPRGRKACTSNDWGLAPGAVCRDLLRGECVRLPGGGMVVPEDVITPAPRGRKVVIVPDTDQSMHMAAISQDADVVVHEATGVRDDRSIVALRGHSSADAAGEFAKAVNARLLVLTHISQKVRPVVGQATATFALPGSRQAASAYAVAKEKGVTSSFQLAHEASAAFGSPNVIVAQDLLKVSVPRDGFQSAPAAVAARANASWGSAQPGADDRPAPFDMEHVLSHPTLPNPHARAADAAGGDAAEERVHARSAPPRASAQQQQQQQGGSQQRHQPRRAPWRGGVDEDAAQQDLQAAAAVSIVRHANGT
ncbi:beta-lactamase-like protein [Tribonema minus]|uniref:Beta-lactamase-like protein n=1 Tax=Tribonema minus TaxID=303371 RepID=A0A835Z7K6_9STRA|nr:beta-lactamase-like protein [Tribonema minus]